MKVASTMKMKSTPKLGTCKVHHLLPEKLLMTPHLDRHITTDPKPEMISAVYTGNRIQRDERNVLHIEHRHMFRKDNILENTGSNIGEGGEGDYGAAELYSCFKVYVQGYKDVIDRIMKTRWDWAVPSSADKKATSWLSANIGIIWPELIRQLLSLFIFSSIFNFFLPPNIRVFCNFKSVP